MGMAAANDDLARLSHLASPAQPWPCALLLSLLSTPVRPCALYPSPELTGLPLNHEGNNQSHHAVYLLFYFRLADGH
jgi:hypothetical protein